jgi:hypothetical protein
LRGGDEQQDVEQHGNAQTFEHGARSLATARLVKHARRSRARALITEATVFDEPRKEKPGGGNAGSDFFVIGVYGFKYAAWLLLVALESAERLVFIVQPICLLVLLFSCSSLTFQI